MDAKQANTRRLATSLCLAVMVASSMGASCTQRMSSPFGPTVPTAPVVLSPTPTAADLVAAVNQNTAKVQTYQAQRVSIATPESLNAPLVSGSIAAERSLVPGDPWRFRMRASTAITGPEIDLGSNDERFWVWARRNEPPALFTARHSEWAASPTRGQAPIEPAWLVEALGLVTLDPAEQYQGPFPRGNDAWELHTQTISTTGSRRRVLVVDKLTAEVREQHVYDAAGSPVASVVADRFRYDSASGASLPERVRLNVPAAQLKLTINTGGVAINAPIAAGAAVWTPPQLEGYPVVDLATAPDGIAESTRAWDLTGATAAYRPPPIAASFGERPAARSYSAASGGPSSRVVQAGPSQPANLHAPPKAPAQNAGYSGLPAGGRTITAP